MEQEVETRSGKNCCKSFFSCFGYRSIFAFVMLIILAIAKAVAKVMAKEMSSHKNDKIPDNLLKTNEVVRRQAEFYSKLFRVDKSPWN